MEIKETETLLKTQYLDLKATQYLDNNGKEKYWVWCTRGKTKAVVVAAYVSNGFKVRSDGAGYYEDKSLVVIKEKRVPLNDFEIGFPAGLVDDGEDVIEAAKREFKEETGLDVKRVIKVSPFVYNSAGLSDEAIAMVFIEATGNISNDLNEASEEIEIMLLSKKEVENILQNTSLKIGAKAWLVMDRFVSTNEII